MLYSKGMTTRIATQHRSFNRNGLYAKQRFWLTQFWLIVNSGSVQNLDCRIRASVIALVYMKVL